MKIKTLGLILGSLCLSSMALAGHHHDNVAISVNLPGPTTIVAANRPLPYPPPPAYYPANPPHYHHHHHEPAWVDMVAGAALPPGAVVGGSQSHPPATLFVCRAHYRGGMHPGQLINGYCNISWGGNEISMSHYEVLISNRPLNWIAGGNGYMPVNAVQGGYQHDGPLYVCQANYNGGMHPGKVVAGMCNIGWHGREIAIPYYNVLVR